MRRANFIAIHIWQGSHTDANKKDNFVAAGGVIEATLVQVGDQRKISKISNAIDLRVRRFRAADELHEPKNPPVRRRTRQLRWERAMDGVWTRVKLACAAFVAILFKGELPAGLQGGATAPTPAPRAPVVADPVDRAVQILALLQRDGRLVDFLMEDVAAYSDAEIGSAVRDVHAGCRRALDRYLTLEAILDGREGEATTISQVNPAAVRLVGNVTGQPPFRGTLLHRGWRTTRVDLPPLGADPTRSVVAQAEVEVA